MSETMNRGQLKLPFLVCWINTKKKQTKKKKLNADLLTVTIYTTLFWIRKLNYKDYANVLDLIFFFFFLAKLNKTVANLKGSRSIDLNSFSFGTFWDALEVRF